MNKAQRAGPRLTEGGVGQSIRSMMLPMLIGMVAIISYSIVDTYFIAQLGTLELAAISFTFPVSFLVGAVIMGLGVGTSSVCARLIGADQRDQVERVAIHAVLLGLVCSLLLIGIGVSTIDPLFRLLGADDSTLPIIDRYMSIYYWGGLFMVVPMTLNSVLRASGNAKTPALIMTASALFNIILDPILIFGLMGAPRMEVEGAAIATIIANVLTLFASLYVVCFKEKIIQFRALWPSLIIDSWRRILHVGLPSMASSLIAPITTGFITYQVAKFGQETVAGFGVASRLEAFFILALMALAAAAAPFVGQNHGAQQFNRVNEGVNWCFKFSLKYGLLVAAVVAIAAPSIARLFTDEPVAIETAVLHMRIVPISYLALGMAMVANTVFNAIGKPMPGMAISLSRTVMVYAPLAFILSHWFGLVGIFAAACAANFISGAIGVIWLRTTFSSIEKKVV